MLATLVLGQLDGVATVGVIHRGKLPTIRTHDWHVGLDSGGVNGCCRSHEDELQTAGRFAHAIGVAEDVPLASTEVVWGTPALVAQEAEREPVLVAHTRDLAGYQTTTPHGFTMRPCVLADAAALAELYLAA